jgi:hypothetical protein
MATLVLDKVPDELLSQLEQLAARERLPVAEKTVRLLQEAVGRRALANGSRVQEILERLIRNRFRSVRCRFVTVRGTVSCKPLRQSFDN